MDLQEGNYLLHYGVKRRSGRYPWGSGGTDLSEAKDFRTALEGLRKEGLTDTQIAKQFDFKTPELRANIAISSALIKQDKIAQARYLVEQRRDSPTAAGRKMGINESSVRALLKEGANQKQDVLISVADELKRRVDEDGYIDVGKGVAQQFGIAKTKLDTAIAMVETAGYTTHQVKIPQVNTGHDTRGRVLARPGTTWQEANKNRALIAPAKVYSDDGGRTFERIKEPVQINPKRLQVLYGPEGGAKADGVIYVRPGVDDLSMGGARYAQVRISVGPNHYLKGMAVLKDDLPPGIDLQFNTNKKTTGNKLDALKPIDDPSSLPIERYGAIFRQTHDAKTKKQSALNLVNDESDWDNWSKTLATQFLSKQPRDLVKKQLEITYANKKAQLDEIKQLTQPVVRKKLLESYSDDMDSSSVHLKAASLPRQKTHVILPINSLKDNEVYAPGYRNGESLVLVRYPHGGKFEIPELTVNNGNRQGKQFIGADSRAAIGINSNVASRLSGADFDGDTVVVIPNSKKRIQTESPLEGLKGFDPQDQYPEIPGVSKRMKKGQQTQTEMGKISNLITDMSIAGAPNSELVRAVRHSMVVIDAAKHGLDYKRSAEDNAILALRKKYQPGKHGGATTIVSRTQKPIAITEVKRRPASQGGAIDKKTGELIYVPSGNTRSRKVVDPDTGEEVWVKEPKTAKVARGSRLPGTGVTDAYDLVSGSPGESKATRGTIVERHYAEYSNKVRGLANEARRTLVNTPDPKISPSAKKVYAKEVVSLKEKLREAQLNAPRERQAQLAAAVMVKVQRDANPDMEPEKVKRLKTTSLRVARERAGAQPKKFDITPREWEAIQNNAIGHSVLSEILTKANMDQIRDYATPQTKLKMQPHNEARAKSLLANGYTRSEVAEELGVSVSTLDRALG